MSKGAPKGEPDDEEEKDAGDGKEEDQEATLEDEHLSDAFAAMKSGDKEAFVEAMKSFKGC